MSNVPEGKRLASDFIKALDKLQRECTKSLTRLRGGNATSMRALPTKHYQSVLVKASDIAGRVTDATGALNTIGFQIEDLIDAERTNTNG